MINISYAYKNLGLFVELCFSHMFMPIKFELQLISRTVDIYHACSIIAGFVIFILDKIVYV